MRAYAGRRRTLMRQPPAFPAMTEISEGYEAVQGECASLAAVRTPSASGARMARKRSASDRRTAPLSASVTDTCSFSAICELMSRSISGTPSRRATYGAIILPPAP